MASSSTSSTSETGRTAPGFSSSAKTADRIDGQLPRPSNSNNSLSNADTEDDSNINIGNTSTRNADKTRHQKVMRSCGDQDVSSATTDSTTQNRQEDDPCSSDGNSSKRSEKDRIANTRDSGRGMWYNQCRLRSCLCDCTFGDVWCNISVMKCNSDGERSTSSSFNRIWMMMVMICLKFAVRLPLL